MAAGTIHGSQHSMCRISARSFSISILSSYIAIFRPGLCSAGDDQYSQSTRWGYGEFSHALSTACILAGVDVRDVAMGPIMRAQIGDFPKRDAAQIYEAQLFGVPEAG